MSFSPDRRNIQTMGRLHIRGVVKAADESIGGNVHGTLDIAISPQRKVRQPSMLPCGHTKLHGRTGGSRWQIKRMFELDFLSLGQAEGAGDVGKGLLRKDDRTWSHRANAALELHVLDCFGKKLQSATILLEETQARSIDLAVDQKPDQALMAETRGKRQFSLRYIKSSEGITQFLSMQARRVLERSIAHCGVVAIYIESPHQLFCSSRIASSSATTSRSFFSGLA